MVKMKKWNPCNRSSGELINCVSRQLPGWPESLTDDNLDNAVTRVEPDTDSDIENIKKHWAIQTWATYFQSDQLFYDMFPQ